MRTVTRTAVAVLAVVGLAACGGGSVASTGPGASTAPVGSGGPGASAAADACALTTKAATVEATMADFKFAPEPIQAKIGDIIEWTNNGPSDHNPTLDGNAVCIIGAIPAAGVSSAGMTFSVAGTYAYTCAIHPSMKGTIVVSP